MMSLLSSRTRVGDRRREYRSGASISSRNPALEAKRSVEGGGRSLNAKEDIEEAALSTSSGINHIVDS